VQCAIKRDVMTAWGQTRTSRRVGVRSVHPRTTDMWRPFRYVRFVSILLPKSKIEPCQKSCESGFLDSSTTATLDSPDTGSLWSFSCEKIWSLIYF
jgi:hypothetical protein